MSVIWEAIPNFIKQNYNHDIVGISNAISSTCAVQKSIGNFEGFSSISLIDLVHAGAPFFLFSCIYLSSVIQS